MGNYSLKLLSSALCYKVVVPDKGGPFVFLFLFLFIFLGGGAICFKPFSQKVTFAEKLRCRKALSTHWRGLILHHTFNHDGALCIYTCVFTEREEGEGDQRFSSVASFSDDEINTSPANLSKLIFLFHFRLSSYIMIGTLNSTRSQAFTTKPEYPSSGETSPTTIHPATCTSLAPGTGLTPFVFSFPPHFPRQLLLPASRRIKRRKSHDACLSVAHRVQLQSGPFRNYILNSPQRGALTLETWVT